MAAQPPLPPDLGTREEAPTVPEQVPGGETTPIIPPVGDVQTGQPTGVQMVNTWGPEKVLPKLESVLEEGLSPRGLVNPEELESQLVKQGYSPEDATEVANRAMGLTMTAGPAQGLKGLGGLLQKLFKGADPAMEAQRIRGAKGTSPGKLGQTPFEPNWKSAQVSSDALQEDLNRFINTYKDEYESARKGKTDEETHKLLEKAMKEKYPDLMKALNMRGSALTDVQTRALLSYLQAAVEEYHKALDAGAKNLPGSVEALTKQSAVVQALMYKILPQRRETGAALRAYREEVTTVKTGHAIMDAADLTAAVQGMDVEPQRLAKLLSALSREQRVRVLANNAQRRLISPGSRTTGDEIASLYVDSLLLNFGTQQRNFTGNLFRALTFIPERAVEGTVGRTAMAFGSKEVHHIPSEAMVMAASVPSAAMAGIRAFSAIYKSGDSMFYGKKVDMKNYRNILQRESFPLAVQRLGHYWAAGSRGLFYADEAFKMFIYQMEKNAAAHRYAFMLGKTADERSALFARFSTKPPQAIVDEAMESAAVGTMTAQGGKIMQLANTVADGYNPYTRMMMPFVTATGNMAKQSYQRTPILNMLSYEHWSAVQQGGRKADAAVARMGSGLILGSVFAAMAANGTLHGSGNAWSPEYRRAKQEEGWESCTMVVGGKNIPIQNLGPWGVAACATADLVEAFDYMTPTEWQAAVMTFGQSYGMLISETAFMESMGKFFEATRNDDPDAAMHYVARTVTGFIPRGTQEVADLLDPGRVMKQAEGGIYDASMLTRAMGVLANEIAARTPIAKGSLLPMDRGPILGEPLTSSSSFGWINRTRNPRLRDVNEALTPVVPYSVFNIEKSIGGEGMVEMPGQPGLPARVPGVTILPEDRSELLRIRGSLKIEGKTLLDTLHDLVKSKDWDELKKSPGPGGVAEKVVKRIVQGYTKSAFVQFDESYTEPAYPGGGPGGLLEQKGTVKQRKGQRKAGEE